RCGRLGVTSVSLTGGRLVYQGIDVPRDVARKLKQRRAIVYPKTRKLAYPFSAGKEGPVIAALAVLEEVGGDDEDE
ncbi:MAG: hypothetical protein SOH58_08265, partial [Olsenella sp.]